MNLFIHRAIMWFAVLAALVGVYSVYLGGMDHYYHCLPHAGFVYVIYGSAVVVMSLWLVERMGEHIMRLKMTREIAYWNNYWKTQTNA